MNFKSYLLTFISLPFIIKFVDCSKNRKDDGYSERQEDTLNAADDSTWAGYLLKLNSALVAYNTKKEYEIGKMIAKIISAKKSGSKINNENHKLQLPVTDNFIIKSHMNSLEIYNDILKNGLSNEKNRLKNETYDFRIKVLSYAIKNEKIDLIKDLVGENIIKIDTHIYEFAVDIARYSKTEMADSIVNFLSTLIGYNPSASRKLDLGFEIFPIFEAIKKSDFPLLLRALDLGLDPNTELIGYGSLLCASVFFRCAQCVEILVQRNADVNAHMKMDFTTSLEAIKQIMGVNGWTPLMVAIGQGQERIIKALIASGIAEVSRTSIHDKFLHARAVARKIDNKNLKMKILNYLILSKIELIRLSSMTKGKDFLSAVIEGNYSVVDAFLLQKPNLGYKIPIEIKAESDIIEESVSQLLKSDLIKII